MKKEHKEFRIFKQQPVADICSRAEWEKNETYEENLEKYKKKSYSYIPIPFSKKYYDLYSEELKNLKDEQIVSEDFPMFDAMKLLKKHKFLLIDFLGNKYFIYDSNNLVSHSFLMDKPGLVKNFSFSENEIEVVDDEYVRNNFPEVAQGTKVPRFIRENFDFEEDRLKEILEVPDYSERFGIVTVFDLNTRQFKHHLYPLIACLVEKISGILKGLNLLEDEFFPKLKNSTIGAYKKAELVDYSVDLIEYLNIVEMKEVLGSFDQNRIRDIGFESKNKMKKRLYKINRFRNRVMHANRSLVEDRSDLDDVLDLLENLNTILVNIDN